MKLKAVFASLALGLTLTGCGSSPTVATNPGTQESDPTPKVEEFQAPEGYDLESVFIGGDGPYVFVYTVSLPDGRVTTCILAQGYRQGGLDCDLEPLPR